MALELVPGSDAWLFNRAFGFTQLWEGKVSNRDLSADPGGLTNAGIIQATWDNYAPSLGFQTGPDALVNATPEQLKAVAEAYWKATQADTAGMTWQMRLFLFEARWASGAGFETWYKANYGRDIHQVTDWREAMKAFQIRLTRLDNYSQNPGWLYRYGMAADPWGRKSWPAYMEELEADESFF